jgi:hypothetical protein
MVEPDGAGVALAGLHEVGALLDVQLRLVPAQAVLRGGVGRAALGEIPHLEEAVLRVVPDAVAEDHAAGEDGALRVVDGPVVRAGQRGLLDEEVIDEELPADVDGDDAGRRGEVRRFDRLAGHVGEARRPRRRQADAVVEQLALRGGVGVADRQAGDAEQAQAEEAAATEDHGTSGTVGREAGGP